MLQLQIIGNLTRDAEIKTSEKTNNSFLTFTIAVNRGKDRQATFVRCMQRYSTYSENIKPYLIKGKKVFAQGSLDVGVFTNNSQQVVADITCFVDNLQLLSPKEDSNETQVSSTGTNKEAQIFPERQQKSQTIYPKDIDNETELPF